MRLYGLLDLIRENKVLTQHRLFVDLVLISFSVQRFSSFKSYLEFRSHTSPYSSYKVKGTCLTLISGLSQMQTLACHQPLRLLRIAKPYKFVEKSSIIVNQGEPIIKKPKQIFLGFLIYWSIIKTTKESIILEKVEASAN